MEFGSGLPGVQVPSGYVTHDEYFVTRYCQGGRTTYVLDLSLMQIAFTLSKPDPERVLPGNRRIKRSHAEGFARYLRENENWTAPPILLRASASIFAFEPINLNVPGVTWGTLRVPKLLGPDQWKIIDGQHRILGIHIAWENLSRDLDAQTAMIARARDSHESATVIEFHERELAKLEAERRRFAEERMTLQIAVEDNPDRFQQMFVDIAENALGISQSVKAGFDHRKVVNRALDDVIEHPLLKGHIEYEKDRVGSNDSALLSLKHVADIVRVVEVGIGGRIGRRLESEINESTLVGATNAFLDTLVGAYEDLSLVQTGELTPGELRRKSLLGSVIMLRVLAGVYHELLHPELGSTAMSPDEIVVFLSSLDMAAPVDPSGPWGETGLFAETGMAPTARSQDLKKLVRVVSNWAREAK